MQFCISFLSNFMNSQCHVVWKTVWILISWLLQKPADLDLHCFQLSLYLVSNCFKDFLHGISKVRAKLSYLCIICSLGQVKFSLDRYIIAMYLSLGKYFFFYISTPLLQAKPCVKKIVSHHQTHSLKGG